MGGGKSKPKESPKTSPIISPKSEKHEKGTVSLTLSSEINQDENLPRIFKELGDNSDKKNSTRERKKLLKILEQKGLESWSVGDASAYIYLSCGYFLKNKNLKQDCPQGLIDTMEKLKIDGEGLLFIGDDFFTQTLENLAKEDHELMKEFFKVMKKIQQDEYGKLNRALIPAPDPKNMFQKYDIPKSPLQIILFYHTATANAMKVKSRTVKPEPTIQPRLWRRYYGSPHYSFPILKGETSKDVNYNEIFVNSAIESKPFGISSLSELFFCSVSLSARPSSKLIHEDPRNAWSKRVNASSSGLHAVEVYAILPSMEGLDQAKGGLYHYNVKDHGLEKRYSLETDQWEELVGTLPEEAFFIGLSTINWRPIWKNGERGFRDAQIDVGLALASIRIATAVLGWRLSILTGISDSTIASLLGIDKIKAPEEEKEFPAILAVIVPTYHIPPKRFNVDSDFLNKLKHIPLLGVPNALTLDKHVHWDLIEKINSSTYVEKENKYSSLFPQSKLNSFVSLPPNFFKDSIGIRATQVLRMRRSATEFSPGQITLNQFGQFLGRLLPSTSLIPWDSAEEWGTNINVCFFIYRVENLPSGYYILMRNKDVLTLDNLKKLTQASNFRWNLCQKLPSEIPLYLLKEEDSETVAKSAAQASGNPDLVFKSAFSCCMIADLVTLVSQKGESFYRNLFWECGMMGQLLFSEAFALGVHAIAPNSFIDECIKSLFGLDKSSQELFYFFTVGKANPVEEYTHIPFSYQKEMYNVIDD